MAKTPKELINVLKEIRNEIKATRADIKSLSGEVRGLRVALAERENDFSKRSKIIEDELLRIDRLWVGHERRLSKLETRSTR